MANTRVHWDAQYLHHRVLWQFNGGQWQWSLFWAASLLVQWVWSSQLPSEPTLWNITVQSSSVRFSAAQSVQYNRSYGISFPLGLFLPSICLLTSSVHWTVNSEQWTVNSKLKNLSHEKVAMIIEWSNKLGEIWPYLTNQLLHFTIIKLGYVNMFGLRHFSFKFLYNKFKCGAAKWSNLYSSVQWH